MSEKLYRIEEDIVFTPPKITLYLKSKTDNTERSMNILDTNFFGVMVDFAKDKNLDYQVLETFINKIEKCSIHDIYAELEVISEIIAKNNLFN